VLPTVASLTEAVEAVRQRTLDADSEMIDGYTMQELILPQESAFQTWLHVENVPYLWSSGDAQFSCSPATNIDE